MSKDSWLENQLQSDMNILEEARTTLLPVLHKQNSRSTRHPTKRLRSTEKREGREVRACGEVPRRTAAEGQSRLAEDLKERRRLAPCVCSPRVGLRRLALGGVWGRDGARFLWRCARAQGMGCWAGKSSDGPKWVPVRFWFSALPLPLPLPLQHRGQGFLH